MLGMWLAFNQNVSYSYWRFLIFVISTSRVRLLRLLATITSYNKSTRSNLPYVPLNTPENVLGWKHIRAYLQSLSTARMAYFNVLMVFVVLFLSVYTSILGYRFWTSKAIELMDINALFIAAVVGTYFLAIIWIGGALHWFRHTI